MASANAKMRRLAVFYCIVVLVFATRAAYAGFFVYATSYFDEDSDCGDSCDPCQPLPIIMYEWTLYNQQYPAIFYAFSSASLSVVSVWFILTAEEKRLLRTGAAKALDERVHSQVLLALRGQVGLDGLL